MVRVLKVRSMPVTSASPSPAVLGLRPSSEVWGVQASASPGRLVADPAGAHHLRKEWSFEAILGSLANHECSGGMLGRSRPMGALKGSMFTVPGP